MEQLYTINEAARVLRISRETLYRWIREGRLTYAEVGPRRRIRESDIRAIIQPKAETPQR